MKTLRLLGVALFTVLLSVSFTACGDDEGNDGSGDKPSINKRLVKVTTQEGSSTFSDEFTYDSNGRVVKVVNKKNGNNSSQTIYTYTDNHIVKKQYNTGSSTVKETEYVLENGLIVEEINTSGYNYKYSYDKGYLATVTKIKEGKGGEYNYTWENGNLKRKQKVNSESEDSYEYTSYVTPQNFYYLDYIEYVNGELAPFYGKSSKNLPSKRIEVNVNDVAAGVVPGSNVSPGPNEEIVTEVFSYDWTMKDGLPVKLIVTEEDQYSPSTMIVDFEWE